MDDYITKPFSPRELVLRVQNLLRRLRVVRNSSVLIADEFCVDKGKLEITIRGRRLDLTTTEFKLLAALVEHRGRTLSRETLLQDVWGYKNAIDTRTVDTHVRRLREKLGQAADRIVTMRGEGYRFLVNHCSVIIGWLIVWLVLLGILSLVAITLWRRLLLLRREVRQPACGRNTFSSGCVSPHRAGNS